jgi:hypothetical protein
MEKQAGIWLWTFVATIATAARADAQTGGLIVTDLVQLPVEASQTAPSPSRAPAPEPCCPSDADDQFALGTAIRQAAGFTIVQHVARLREARTRRELGGPFLDDWFTSVSHTGLNWNDGGKIFTNYIAHPMGGAVYAHIYRQNDPRRRELAVGEPGYGAMVVRAMIFSTVVSTQFELGPLSEASIGNVGLMDPRRMAWGDLVITPTLGTAWMVGEDLLDQRVLARMDAGNAVLRNVVRTVLNPSRSGALLSSGKWPWYRVRDSGR